jgi:hypothetical protein
MYALILWAWLFSGNEKIAASELLARMNQTVSSQQGMFYHFRMEERWFGKMKIAETEIKVMFKPYKVYFKFIISSTPAKEVLYNPELYGDVVVINVGRILPNFKLSPFNSKLRNQQHYTILSVGFQTINHILQETKRRLGKDFDNHCKVEDHLMLNNKEVYRLTLVEPVFEYVRYTLKDGETTNSYARKNHICEYLILERNNYSHYNQVQKNATIWVPNVYCKKCVLYMDKSTYLPMIQEIYDDKGLIEKYIYTNINTEVNYSNKDFSKETEGYGL